MGKEEAEICYETLFASGLQIVNLTPTVAKQTDLLKCRHRNMPMGDCIIAATAMANQAHMLSDDPHFDAIKETKHAWI